jgi:hypothetical protein
MQTTTYKRFTKRVKSFIHRKIQGFIFDFMESSRFKYYTSDVFIVEFPKSGITFLSFLLSNLAVRVNKIPLQPTYFNLEQFVIDIHQTTGLTPRSIINPRFIKSHHHHTNAFKQVIYVVRNPVDVLVSYFNYTNTVKIIYFDSFSTFIRHENRGIKAWINHTQSWLNRKAYHQKIYVVKYEDLVQNPAETLTDLGNMLGYSFSEEDVLESIQASSMENMRESEELYRSHNPGYDMVFIGKEGKSFRKEDITPEDYAYIIDMAQKSELYRKYYGA